MGQVHRIDNYAYGVIQVSAGKHGVESWTRAQRVLISREKSAAFALPRKRRIGRLAAAKSVLRSSMSCDDVGCQWPNCHCHGHAGPEAA